MEYYEFIGSLGFPIFVAIYLLSIFRKSMNDLKDSNHKLKETIKELTNYLKTKNGDK